MTEGGRGQAEIRTSNPVRTDGEILTLVPEEDVNIIKKDRVGLDE